MTLLDRPFAVDFWILDHVFTPAAHFLHDAFGARSRKVAIATFVMSAAFHWSPGDAMLTILIGVVAPAAMIVFLQFYPEPKIGFMNSLRVHWQLTRIWNCGFLIFLIFPTSLHAVLSDIAWVASWWFGSVTDRPRKPLTILSPALLPEGAAS